MQPQDQRVEPGVIARGRGDLVDLGKASAGHGPAGGGQPAGLADLAGRVARVVDQAVVLGLVVQAAQRADEVLDGAAPAAAAWPALALVGSYELLMMVIRGSQVPAHCTPETRHDADPLRKQAALR